MSNKNNQVHCTVNLNSLVNKYITHIPLHLEKMMTTFERKALCSLMLENYTGKDIIEWGTWQGLTTCWLAHYAPQSTIWTINISEEEAKNNVTNKHQTTEILPNRDIGMECKNYSNVFILLKDSLKVNLKDEGVESLDFAFVDGAHDYEHVLNDCTKSLELLRPGGILALHNYNVNHTPNPDKLGDFVEDGPCYYVHTNQQFKWFHVENTVIVYCQKP